ncbi:hypothetical protein HYW32_02125 [Candidatus Berkelbacteria bacterium]|nr:hypothetical protein [Candidatus Berkelbacteria bacterium]
MALTTDDFQKIKAIFDVGIKNLKNVFEAQVSALENKMATKEDVAGLEYRLVNQINSVRKMLEGDHAAVVEDVIELKKFPKRVRRIETILGIVPSRK